MRASVQCRWEAVCASPKASIRSPHLCECSAKPASWHQKNIATTKRDTVYQRRRDDDQKNKTYIFEGGGALGAERKVVQKAIFRGKRHDKILNVLILSSRNVAAIAQAPSVATPVGVTQVLYHLGH